jgi:hypothetical protein
MSQPQLKCIKCNKGPPGLMAINVRHKGILVTQKFVHSWCYAEDPKWVQRQVKGKNPKFHVLGRK